MMRTAPVDVGKIETTDFADYTDFLFVCFVDHSHSKRNRTNYNKTNTSLLPTVKINSIATQASTKENKFVYFSIKIVYNFILAKSK